MATPTNGTGNLVDELEEAFLSLMQALAKEEENFNGFEKDETRVDIDQATVKFLDIVRQLESFFLQKRFVLSSLKPELIMKEEIIELKSELSRKDELLKRHYDKISVWQNILSDLQGWNKAQQQSNIPSNPVVPGNLQEMPNVPTPGSVSAPGGSSPNPAMMTAIQQQLQQQQHMQLQQQQLQMQQQMSVGVPGGENTGGNVTPLQAMYLQQQVMGQQRTCLREIVNCGVKKKKRGGL